MGTFQEVKMVLADKGELSKTGVIYNTNCPVNSVNNVSMPDPSIPQGIFKYTINATETFNYEIPDGWVICKHIPEKPTTVFQTLAAFQLYDRNTEEILQKWVAWEYKVNHWYETSAGSGQNEHKVIHYDIDMRMRLWEEIEGDSLAPYHYTLLNASNAHVEGNYTIEGYSNILGFDTRYIGFVCHRGTYNNQKIFGICMDMRNYLYLTDNRWVIDASSSATNGLFITDDSLYPYKLDPKEKTDPNEPGDKGGKSHEGGGMGDRDDHIDPIPIPPDPNISATDAGFVTLYNPTLAQLQAVGNELYTDSVWEAIKNFFKSPDEYLVGVGIIPVKPMVGASKHPKCGIFSFETAMPVIIHEYVTVNCGSIPITEFYGSAFDYAGMTSISLYLPYIGFRDIDVDDVMGHSLGVVYKVDVYNGNCVAFVTVDGSVHYTFSGNCMQQVPTASQSFDNSVSNGIALAAAVVGAVATGGASTAVEAAAGGAGMVAAGGEAAATTGALSTMSNNAVIGSTMANVMNAKPNVTRSGAIGSSSGLLSVQYPFIVRKIPRQSWADNYEAFAGYPSNMTVVLSSLSGFFVVDSINLSGVPATEEELSEIMAFLKGGVIK